MKVYMTSSKGGTGVTSCALYLGCELARLGERTLIFDGDRSSASGMFAAGLSNMHTYTLADYEKGACRAKQTLLSRAGESNLSFCSSLGLKDENFALKALAELEGLFDFILCDKICAAGCDAAIIVTEPYPAAVKSADFCASFLSDGGFKDIRLFVNKLNGGQVIEGAVMTAQEIANILHLKLAGVIPEDLTLPLGKIKKGTKKAFAISAENLTGRREGVCNVIKNYFGPYGYFKRKMRDRI